jgi:protein ImuB
LFVLRRFLEQLQFRLTGIYLVAKALTLRIQFRNQQTYERRFDIPEPTNSVELLFRMLQTHLEDFKSEHPIVAVSLEAEPVKPLPQQFGLFEASLRNPTQLYETLARLSALLGKERVGTPILEDTHRPDAFRIEPFTWTLPESAEPVTAKTGLALRRFRPNRSVAMEISNGQPQQLRSPELNGRVEEQAGPYTGSGNWWDDKQWDRQEWDVELQNGIVCRVHYNGANWELDGIYD